MVSIDYYDYYCSGRVKVLVGTPRVYVFSCSFNHVRPMVFLDFIGRAVYHDPIIVAPYSCQLV
jgi:hypothetical protein